LLNSVLPFLQSVPDSIHANQYRNVTTPSYVQCAGAFNSKAEDFEIRSTTNTALNNLLETTSIYYLSRKFMPLNDRSIPMLAYIQESVTVTGRAANHPLNFANKANVNSLGIVASCQEVASESEGSTHLEVVVAHNDWDSQVCSDIYLMGFCMLNLNYLGAMLSAVQYLLHCPWFKTPCQNLWALRCWA
jgi:hypothetical protein